MVIKLLPISIIPKGVVVFMVPDNTNVPATEMVKFSAFRSKRTGWKSLSLSGREDNCIDDAYHVGIALKTNFQSVLRYTPICVSSSYHK